MTTAQTTLLEISLPKPRLASDYSVEEAIKRRHSVRDFAKTEVSQTDLSQVLWAAQGITHRGSFRSAPSAGALYPLEIYLVTGGVRDLPPGIYRYIVQGHKLEQIIEGDFRKDLATTAFWQKWIGKAAFIVVIAGVYQRTTEKYGSRGKRYVHMEVGHVGQNIYLQAGALDLGTTMVGAFDDFSVKKLLKMPPGEQPLAVMPVGKSQ